MKKLLFICCFASFLAACGSSVSADPSNIYVQSTTRSVPTTDAHGNTIYLTPAEACDLGIGPDCAQAYLDF